MKKDNLRKVTIKITLTPEAKEMLGRQAKAQGISRASMVEILIRTAEKERLKQQ